MGFAPQNSRQSNELAAVSSEDWETSRFEQAATTRNVGRGRNTAFRYSPYSHARLIHVHALATSGLPHDAMYKQRLAMPRCDQYQSFDTRTYNCDKWITTRRHVRATFSHAAMPTRFNQGPRSGELSDCSHIASQQSPPFPRTDANGAINRKKHCQAAV